MVSKDIYHSNIYAYAKDKTAILQWDEETAHDSRERAFAFLRQAFGL